jgi:hypothetical protein
MKTNERKEVKLTLDRLKELLKYDSNTGVFTWIEKSSIYSKIVVGNRAGYLRPNGYRVIKIDGQAYLEHRLAWLYVHGKFPFGEQNLIDHIDRNPINNCISNLRVCSHRENKRNTSKPRSNTSGLKGVSWDIKSCRYVAQIRSLTGEKIHLGSFATPQEASSVYESKALEYSGVFYPVIIEKDKNVENKLLA